MRFIEKLFTIKVAAQNGGGGGGTRTGNLSVRGRNVPFTATRMTRGRAASRGRG